MLNGYDFFGKFFSFIANEVTKVYAAYKIFTNEILVACKIVIHNSDLLCIINSLMALSCTCLVHGVNSV